LSSAYSLTDIAAFWGAFSGSLAVILQGLVIYKDKAKLKLIPTMTIASTLSSDPREMSPLIDFEVNVVNNGRRVAFIEEVGIHVKGKWNLFKRASGVKVILFSSKNEGAYKQIDEGHKVTFQKRRWLDHDITLAENMANKELVYIKLTSGEKINKTFKTISMSKFEKMKSKYKKKV